MKKKLLIIPLLLLTSCNDPMFFEGKKATHEEMQSVIDKIDNNGAFIKPSWYEYNAEIIETYTHNNHSVDIAKSIYNIKFLTGIKFDSGILGFQRLIGTRKNYEKLNNKSDKYVKYYEYFGNENEMFICIHDIENGEIHTKGNDKHSLIFNPLFLIFYSDNYELYIKENNIHIKFYGKLNDGYMNRDLAFSYDKNYDLKIGKIKMDTELPNEKEIYKKTSFETLTLCEEQDFEIRKDYEEKTIYKYNIF